MSANTSWSVGHKQMVELANSFFDGLVEAQENVELEILNVLRRSGAYVSS